MQPRYPHIIHSALALLMVALLAVIAPACASRDDLGGGDTPVPPAHEVEYQAGFFLTVSNQADPSAQTASSRTPQDGSYDPGEGWENHIDLTNRNLRVIILDADNRFVRELRDFDIVPYAETPGSKTYHLHCRVAADQKWEPNFKFMVLANWPSYPVAGADPSGSDAPLSFTTGYDFSLPSNPLWTSVYTYNPEPLSDTNLIPLYGVKTCTEELVEGRYVSLGTLHLLRALAKVEVIFPADNNPYDFWEIETMELLRHNTAGFCAPTGVLSQDDYVKNSYNGDYVATPSIPEGYETGEPMPLVEVEKNRRWVLYLPEYRNVGRPDSEKARIHVAFRNTSVTREQFIDFKEYDNGGKPFDILRNNWYKFTLSKNSEFQNLTIEVDVRYYASVELRPGFGN